MFENLKATKENWASPEYVKAYGALAVTFAYKNLKNKHVEQALAVAKSILKYRELKYTIRILDMGCGPGIISLAVARAFKKQGIPFEMVCFDYDKGMWRGFKEKLNRKKNSYFSDKIKLFEGNLIKKDFGLDKKYLGEGMYDIIMMNNVLYTIDKEKKLAILKKAYSLLKNEGRFLFSGPYARPGNTWAEREANEKKISFRMIKQHILHDSIIRLLTISKSVKIIKSGSDKNLSKKYISRDEQELLFKACGFGVEKVGKTYGDYDYFFVFAKQDKVDLNDIPKYISDPFISYKRLVVNNLIRAGLGGLGYLIWLLL